MNLDDLIDGHTGREENLLRQKENFARAAKARRQRRLAKRDAIYHRRANAMAEELVRYKDQVAARAAKENRPLTGREAYNLAQEIVEREGVRGVTLLIHPGGYHEWADIDVHRHPSPSSYIEVPLYRGRSGVRLNPFDPPPPQLGVTSRRYEVIDRLRGTTPRHGGPPETWVLNQVA